MGSTIGILGHKDIVKVMLDISIQQYPQYSFLDLSYDDERESEGTFRKNHSRMDVCLFTGVWPYTKVRSTLGQTDLSLPMVYASHSGAIYKTIARMLNEGGDMSRVSVDAVSKEEAWLSFSEVGLQPQELFLMPFSDAAPREQYISFHQDLWREGRTTSMITLHTNAYKHLHREGFPVFHCSIGVAAMREAIVHAVLELQTAQMREQQIVVGLVDVATPRGQVSDEMYANQRHKTSLYQALLDFGESAGLSVVPLEGLRFALFLTMGSLNQITNRYTSLALVSKLCELSGSSVFCGFGVGPTVNACYVKALMAQNNAKQCGESSAFVVFDNGDVCGPLGARGASLAYNTRSINKQRIANSQDSGIGVATLSKVKAVIESGGTTLITPERLADELRISKRNARRILIKLTNAGLARVKGIDQTGNRGRPQRLFQVNLD